MHIFYENNHMRKPSWCRHQRERAKSPHHRGFLIIEVGFLIIEEALRTAMYKRYINSIIIIIIIIIIINEIWHLWETIVREEKLDWKPNLRTVNIKTFGGECDLRDTTKVDCQVRGVTSASQYYKGSLNQTRHRPKKCLTFTSPVVWRKHVTQRTRTPEWSEQVCTEMGANTWVSSTFINIWIRNITEML